MRHEPAALLEILRLNLLAFLSSFLLMGYLHKGCVVQVVLIMSMA